MAQGKRISMRISHCREAVLELEITGSESEVEMMRAEAIKAVMKIKNNPPVMGKKPCGCKGS